MSNCARCNGELPRSRVHVDGKEFHLECHRTEADWREIDRLAEIAMQGLCAVPDMFPMRIAADAYNIAEAMVEQRKRRRET